MDSVEIVLVVVLCLRSFPGSQKPADFAAMHKEFLRDG
jgi:hypothetical protein